MTPDELRALSDRAVVELGWALEGMSDEPLTFSLDRVDRGRELFTFVVFYFDVPIGTWVAKIQQEVEADRSDGERVVWVKADKK